MEEECIFCRIVRKERPAEIVYEDDTIVAFKDRFPHAPVHLLLVPRKHIRSINDLADSDWAVVSTLVMKARELAERFHISRSGYKLLFNVERGAGQVIFHLHLHLIGGWDRERA
ncbi:MAG TPA: histidine triad nucleotide-binding protein [Syntrophorhabdaceae bacterium]|jgi:histidine triad (HIT) family protein